ncbi:hypothetical protein NN561_009610 [Cricetulus griseus]
MPLRLPAPRASGVPLVLLSRRRGILAWLLPLSLPDAAPTSGSPRPATQTSPQGGQGETLRALGCWSSQSPPPSPARAPPARGAVTGMSEDRSIPAGCRARARRLGSSDPAASRRQVPCPQGAQESREPAAYTILMALIARHGSALWEEAEVIQSCQAGIFRPRVGKRENGKKWSSGLDRSAAGSLDPRLPRPEVQRAVPPAPKMHRMLDTLATEAQEALWQ